MASQRSVGTAGTTSTAGAFRDVQAKVDAMRTELEERQSEVARLQKELASVRGAAQRSSATLEGEWREKVQVMVEEQDEALGRQQAFVDQLSSDVHKLKEKRGELDDGVDELWSNCLALPMRHAQRHARSVYAGSNAAGHRETARRLLLCVGQLLLRGGDEAKGLALSVELPEALAQILTLALTLP